MVRKSVRSDTELSHDNAETIRDIIDKQIRQYDNIEYIKKIVNDVSKANYYKNIAIGAMSALMLILNAGITFYSNRFFQSTVTPSKTEQNQIIVNTSHQQPSPIAEIAPQSK